MMDRVAWSALFLAILVAIACIDARRQVIPDALNLALLAAGLVRALTGGSERVLAAAGAATAVFVLMFAVRAVHARLRGRVGLGLGDVKFLAAATAWVGIDAVPVAVLIASLSGLAYAHARGMLGHPYEANARLAFGPHLTLGFSCVWLGGVSG